MKTFITALGLFLPNALALGPVALADNSTPGSIVSFDASTESSQNYTGQAYTIDWDHKFEDGGHVLLGTHLFTRRFASGTQITDEGVSGGYVAVLSQKVYWENGLLINPGATFTPLWAAQTTPHFMIGANDLSLGVGASRYAVMTAGTLSPRLLHEFRHFSVGAGMYATRTYDDVIAYYGVVMINPVARHSLRVDYSFGRTIEDQGIETDYHALTVAYSFQISGRWKIGPWASFFRGFIRNEDSYGIKLDVGL